jgi:regulation of enolase protein 1 (concanavalin A-like superfamily)
MNTYAFCHRFAFKRAIASALIYSLGAVLSCAVASPLPGLVGHWQFEEGTGTTTADSSGNGLTGTLVAGPVWVSSPLGTNALDFNTGADGVDLGNPVSLQITGALTLTAWGYVDSIASAGRFIAKGGASGRRGWGINVEANNTWAFQIAGNSTTSISLNAPNVITGQWVHVAGVYDPTVPAMRFYVYGQLVAERMDIPTSHFNSPANAWIGRRENGTEFDGRIDEVRVFNRALSAEEIRALPEVVPTPLTFVTQPVNRTVAQFRPVTFTSAVRGSPPYFFHWFSNGVEIAGATASSYTLPSVTLDMSGSQFSVTVSNFISNIASTNAVLTVTQDTNPPVLVSVGSVDGNRIGVCFNEPVDSATATEVFNYNVNDFSVGVQQADLRPDGRSVLLTLSAPITGSFTVKVTEVYDLSGNPIAPASTAAGTVADMAPTDVASPGQPGATFSCNDGDFDVTAGGDDIWDTSDQGHISLKSVSGDFDVKVRVIGLTPVNDIAKAGLMVRETTDPGSPTLHLLANPPPPEGRGWIEAGRRIASNGGTSNWGTNFTAAVMPNVWLRLRRTGDLFTGFYSTNGVDWVIMAKAVQVLPDTLLVGLAATARDDAAPPALAQFRAFGSMVFSNPTLNFTQHPTNTTAPQNSTVTFTALAEGTGAPASELIYQWQRFDEFNGIFTNIAGANSSTLSVFARPQDDGAQFRVRAWLAGLVANSQVATLALTPDITPPAIQSVLAPGQGNIVVVTFTEAVAQATATALDSYAISNLTAGAAVTILMAELSADGRTVTLTTELLSEDALYRITVNGVQDLGEPPNTIAPNSQAQFQYNSLVAYWQFEEGSGTTTADSSGNGFTGTLLNGPAWVPGLFGNYALDFAVNRVDCGNPAALQLTGPMTVAAWVYVDSLADNGRIVTKGGGSGQRGWSLNVEGIDVWAFQVAISGSANISLNVAGIPIRKWTHVAGVYDSSVPVMRLYTNGVLGGELTAGVPPVQYNSPLNVSIGARPVNQTFFDGRIDEVRIHARALSGPEVAQLARPRFLPATIAGGQIQLDWGGYGRLEWAPALTGSWTPVNPQPQPPYSEAVTPGEVRIFRLNATQP